MHTLARFCLMVKRGYRDPPYHNWMHAFSVSHFCYLLCKNLELSNYLEYEHTEISIYKLCYSKVKHTHEHLNSHRSVLLFQGHRDVCSFCVLHVSWLGPQRDQQLLPGGIGKIPHTTNTQTPMLYVYLYLQCIWKEFRPCPLFHILLCYSLILKCIKTFFPLNLPTIPHNESKNRFRNVCK
jgi:hypothetical protein